MEVKFALIKSALVGSSDSCHLDGGAYLEFLPQMLPELFDDLPLHVEKRMYFLHDGAPLNFHQDVGEFLSNTFSGRWIGPVASSLSGHKPLKILFVYKTEINSVKELISNDSKHPVYYI